MVLDKFYNFFSPVLKVRKHNLKTLDQRNKFQNFVLVIMAYFKSTYLQSV